MTSDNKSRIGVGRNLEMASSNPVILQSKEIRHTRKIILPLLDGQTELKLNLVYHPGEVSGHSRE